MCPDACASRSEEEDEEIELELTDADINDDGLFELYKAFNITGDFGSSKNRGHGSFDPSWTAPMLKPEDLMSKNSFSNPKIYVFQTIKCKRTRSERRWPLKLLKITG